MAEPARCVDTGSPGLAKEFEGRQHRRHVHQSHSRARREARQRPPGDGVRDREPVRRTMALSAKRKRRPGGAERAVLTRRLRGPGARSRALHAAPPPGPHGLPGSKTSAVPLIPQMNELCLWRFSEVTPRPRRPSPANFPAYYAPSQKNYLFFLCTEMHLEVCTGPHDLMIPNPLRADGVPSPRPLLPTPSWGVILC